VKSPAQIGTLSCWYQHWILIYWLALIFWNFYFTFIIKILHSISVALPNQVWFVFCRSTYYFLGTGYSECLPCFAQFFQTMPRKYFFLYVHDHYHTPYSTIPAMVQFHHIQSCITQKNDAGHALWVFREGGHVKDFFMSCIHMSCTPIHVT